MFPIAAVTWPYRKNMAQMHPVSIPTRKTRCFRSPTSREGSSSRFAAAWFGT